MSLLTTPARSVHMPFLYTRIAILVGSILASAFVLANPVNAAPASPARPLPSTSHVTAHAATMAPAPAAHLPAAIEPMAAYVPQTACDPVVRTGTRKLATLLMRTFRAAGAGWASAYACGTDGDPSEHYDGRAIDWMVNVHDRSQHAAARAAIRWLLATDPAGNKFAMARRLGVMYLIYDNRIWGSWDGRWDAYDGCADRPSHADDNACHRTHMHISLSWNGARGRTSYWTGHVARTDYGPCRPADLNWAPRYSARNTAGPCRSYATVRAPQGSSAVKKALVEYSGAFLRHRSRGPAVTAVQHALGVAATGYFGARTRAGVRAFQSRHHCAATGRMTPRTWRRLLSATR